MKFGDEEYLELIRIANCGACEYPDLDKALLAAHGECERLSFNGKSSEMAKDMWRERAEKAETELKLSEARRACKALEGFGMK